MNHFASNLQTRKESHLQHVCSVEDHDNLPPKKYAQSIDCPEGCKEYRMSSLTNDEKNSSLSIFTLGQDGRTLSIKESSAYSKVNKAPSICGNA